MSQQESSKNILAAQKSVVDTKQTTVIRKITIQSITPVIQKLQEHITYLLGEMNFLRKENNNLTTATATQAILKQNYIKICTDYESLSNEIRKVSKEKDVKIQQKQKQIDLIRQDIKHMRQQSAQQLLKIQQINKSNDDYLQRIQRNKEQQLQSIDVLKQRINQYYEQQLIKIDTIEDQIRYYRSQLQTFHKIKEEEKGQLLGIHKIISLYESDRQLLKKAVQKSSFLENNAVMIEEYNKDKKYQMIQNQQLKKQIRKMIDQALTPDIRKFLPILILKLDQLNSFDETLKKLISKVEDIKSEHDNKFSEIESEWKTIFETQKSKTQYNFRELTSNLTSNTEKLDEKITTNEQIASMKHYEFRNDVEIMEKALYKKINQTVQTQIFNLDKNIKEYIVVWGQNFLDKKKDDIFLLVQESKPPQQKQQENKMIQIVNKVQPVLQQVQIQLKKSSQAAAALYQKLALYNNYITKFKSDVNQIQAQNAKKVEILNMKIGQNKQTSLELSQMTSKLLEAHIISYALSLNKKFMNKDDEVYVTYNDGLILEVNDKKTLYYRRKQMIPQLFKRTVLTELVKLIDHNIIKKPLLGWHNNQLKPSHLFYQVAATYTTAYEENAEFFNTRNELMGQQCFSPLSSRVRKEEPKQQKDRKLLNAKQVKQLSNMPKIASKQVHRTIEEGLKSFNSTIRYQEHPERQQYSSKRRSVHLKKIQK